MDLMDLLKLAGIAVQAQQVSSEPSCGDGMGESEGAGFDEATTEPNPAEFPDGISTLGSVSDTSLRRYLKARGDHVTVDEDIYPDYAVEDVAESYKAFAEKAPRPASMMGLPTPGKRKAPKPLPTPPAEKAVNEGSSNLGDTYMKHLHIKYNNKKSLSKSEAKEVKDLMTRNTIADIKKLAASGIRHVSDAAKDHLKRYVPSNMKKESLELDEAAKPDFLDIDKDGNKKEPMKKAAKDKKQVGEAAKPDYIDIDGDGDKKEPMKKAAKDKEETKANESLNYLKKLAGVA
jgi:hypothetical protein